MSSLLTNNSAITALQSLNMTQKSLQMTQSQISTGLKVNSAADNASYWSIATTMKSDNGALGAVKDALNVSGSMLDTFTSALNQTLDVVNKIKNSLVTAQQPGSDLSKVQTDIGAQQKELSNISGAASFNGQNWLSFDASATGFTATAKLVASYDNANGVKTIDVTKSATQLFDGDATHATPATKTGILDKAGAAYTTQSISTMDVSGATVTATDITNMLKDVDSAIKSLTTAASSIGATRSNVTTQQTFISNLSDSLTKGVGSLVDADMNEASTRLQALQTQQQLGVQSLSIANQNTQMILKLFG